jgi:hypothetical protein
MTTATTAAALLVQGITPCCSMANAALHSTSVSPSRIIIGAKHFVSIFDRRDYATLSPAMGPTSLLVKIFLSVFPPIDIYSSPASNHLYSCSRAPTHRSPNAVDTPPTTPTSQAYHPFLLSDELLRHHQYINDVPKPCLYIFIVTTICFI